MTGRGAGYCAGYDVPGYIDSVPGMGGGMGMGWRRGRGGGGRGWRNWYHATGLPRWARFGGAPAWGAAPAYGPYAPPPPAPEQEAQGLRQQAEWLQGQLDEISKRLEEIEAQG